MASKTLETFQSDQTQEAHCPTRRKWERTSCLALRATNLRRVVCLCVGSKATSILPQRLTDKLQQALLRCKTTNCPTQLEPSLGWEHVTSSCSVDALKVRAYSCRARNCEGRWIFAGSSVERWLLLTPLKARSKFWARSAWRVCETTELWLPKKARAHPAFTVPHTREVAH